MDWYWILLDLDGKQLDVPDVMSADQRFPSQSDAESWIGEFWPELLAAGVSSVTLRETDRDVYGPMRLTPLP